MSEIAGRQHFKKEIEMLDKGKHFEDSQKKARKLNGRGYSRWPAIIAPECERSGLIKGSFTLDTETQQHRLNFNLLGTMVTFPPTQPLGSLLQKDHLQVWVPLEYNTRVWLQQRHFLWNICICMYILPTLQTFSSNPNIYQRRPGEGFLGGRGKFNFQRSPMTQSNTTCYTVPLCRYGKVFPRNLPINFYLKKG